MIITAAKLLRAMGHQKGRRRRDDNLRATAYQVYELFARGLTLDLFELLWGMPSDDVQWYIRDEWHYRRTPGKRRSA